MQVQSLGWEDALEEGMATHSSILAWRIRWREEPGGLQSTAHDWSDWAARTVGASVKAQEFLLLDSSLFVLKLFKYGFANNLAIIR